MVGRDSDEPPVGPLLVAPGVERIHDRTAVLVANAFPLLARSGLERALDPKQRADVAERLPGAVGVGFESTKEVAAPMRLIWSSR